MNRERTVFVATLLAIAVAAAISVLAVWLWWRSAAAECQRTVDARADGRAMFEYLLGEADDPNDPRIVEFRAELDKRLPILVCVDNKPTALTTTEEP